MVSGKARGSWMVAVLAVVLHLGPGAGRAEAYIDPGTGSHLFSSLGLLIGVVGTGIAIAFTQVRQFGGWIVAKVASRRHRAEQSHEEPRQDETA